MFGTTSLATKCTKATHDLLRANEDFWRDHGIGIQEDYDDVGNPAPLELANCSCKTTLARLAKLEVRS